MDTNVDIRVTVLCITYNHAPYIHKCITSLLNQKTSFKYKILVHDDASVDGTADIVNEFARCYPNTVETIVQPVNLGRKGLSRDSYVRPRLEGSYVAFCEGDDWWIDENKLQLQFDYMERHPECALCVHDVLSFDEESVENQRVFPDLRVERDIPTDELICGGGGYFGTNSFFYRVELFDMPSVFLGWGVGDYPRMIFSSLNGTVHYHPQCLSAYRINVPGSWTDRIMKSSTAITKANERIIDGLMRLDEYTDGEFTDSIYNAIYRLRRPILEANRDWQGMCSRDMREYMRTLPMRERIVSWLRILLPEDCRRAIRKLIGTVSMVRR